MPHDGLEIDLRASPRGGPALPPPRPANDNRPDRRIRRLDVLALSLLLTTTVTLGVAVAELGLAARFH
ncbi:hypothetical protein [Methylobacterium sp. JK268]